MLFLNYMKFRSSMLTVGTLMDELFIGAEGFGGLLFYNRSPPDPAEELSSFWFRVTDRNLAASAEILGEEGYPSPAELFTEMAQKWSGWPGVITWQSFLGELLLHCTHYRRRITIRVELGSSRVPDVTLGDWVVKASASTEAGQLDAIARRARRFFGREWEGVISG
jgi:hypothetical protein